MKNKWKKFVLPALCCLLVLSLAGCANPFGFFGNNKLDSDTTAKYEEKLEQHLKENKIPTNYFLESYSDDMDIYALSCDGVELCYVEYDDKAVLYENGTVSTKTMDQNGKITATTSKGKLRDFVDEKQIKVMHDAIPNLLCGDKGKALTSGKRSTEAVAAAMLFPTELPIYLYKEIGTYDFGTYSMSDVDVECYTNAEGSEFGYFNVMGADKQNFDTHVIFNEKYDTVTDDHNASDYYSAATLRFYYELFGKADKTDEADKTDREV